MWDYLAKTRKESHLLDIGLNSCHANEMDSDVASELNFYSLLSILQNGMWLQANVEEYLRKFHISHGQYSILLVLQETASRPIIASQIASKLGRSKPTITKMIEKLLEQEYVVSLNDQNDQRKKTYSLTKKAIKILKEIAPSYAQRINSLCKNIPNAEKALLIGILNKLSVKDRAAFRISHSVFSYKEKCSILKELCESGSKYDIDCVLSFLDSDADIPTTKFVDFYLGTVNSMEGIRRIEFYLFNGSQIQRNFCTLFFARRNEWEKVNRAYSLGLVDYRQAYSR